MQGLIYDSMPDVFGLSVVEMKFLQLVLLKR
jgi:hypothetical protein